MYGNAHRVASLPIKAMRVRVMDREQLTRRLEQLEQEISKTLELVTTHRNILADLGRKEVDAETIQIMLSQLEIQLIFQLQEREKLRHALARLSG
jgi:hypothetical protein